ncbi:MAG: helix-turn-helix domain-containing protein [Oscillospiraceae bacterium]|nr:helix-turn-helix domain-containing protein [Oscillospiraceae bacterium]
MSFGDQLQAVRRAAGLTQEQFAEELKVSRQAVSKWESGRGYPEMEKILYICNYYGVTPNDLFCEEIPHCTAEQTDSTEKEKPPMKKTTLQTALGSFLSNLSPANKWLALGAVLGTTVLSLLIGAFLKGGSTDMIPLIWVGAMVVFGVLEAATVGLTSIWFVVGALGGLIVAMCGGQIWLQLVVFFVVSIAALIAARPLVVKYINQDTTATNADRVLGATARVTESIDNTVPVGAVYVDGKTWSARSENGENIAAGTMVRVTRMEGVRLFVEKEEV